MIVAGIDPSSGTTGIAIVQDGRTLLTHTTFTADKAHTLSHNMWEFHKQLHKLAMLYKPRRFVVERVSVSWNVNTIRRIAYYEAMAMIVAERRRAEVVQMNVSQARKRVLGAGNATKADVTREMSLRWSVNLTPDEADAALLALAAS